MVPGHSLETQKSINFNLGKHTYWINLQKLLDLELHHPSDLLCGWRSLVYTVVVKILYDFSPFPHSLWETQVGPMLAP